MPSKTAGTVSVTDQELQQRSQCTLYVPALVVIDPLRNAAEQAFRWAIKERHAGKIREPEELRVRFEKIWVKAWGDQEKDREYWKGIEKTWPFARRVYFFLMKYRVLQPYKAYTLKCDRGQVTGENAIVVWDKYREGEFPMVLDAPLRQSRFVKTPNYSVLAQWLAARQELETVELGIVHLPMVFGKSWTNKDVKEATAKRWINDLVNEAADKIDFPRTGTQCATCSQACNEVFKGPAGANWNA